MSLVTRMKGKFFKDRSLVLKRSGSPMTILKKKAGQFYLKEKPEELFSVAKLVFTPSLPYSGPGVSRGAVAGAGAYAMLGKDRLKGAIIGDWLEKQRKGSASSSEVHQMSLVLETKSGRRESIEMKVTQDAAIKMARFFKE